jgi:predicted Zn-ribbon and HTH transcriptional regulator
LRIKKNDWLFRSEASELNPDAELLEKYIDSKTKIKVKCKLCGYEYYDLPSNILSGRLHKKTNSGIDGCRWSKNWYHYKDVQSEIVKKLHHIYSRIEDVTFLSPYNAATEKIKCKCNHCGNIYSEKLDNLYSSNFSCDECGFPPTKEALKIEKMFNENQNVRLFQKSESSLKCLCKNCGHVFSITEYIKRRKIICPKCQKERINARKKELRLKKKHLNIQC